MDLRSVGVEEELLLVDPDTGRPRAVAGTILHAARQAESGPGGGPGAAASDAAQALEQPAAVVGLLLDHVSDALADAGDTDTVTGLLSAVLRRGNGAAFQRDAYRRSGGLPEMVSSACAATAPSPNDLPATHGVRARDHH